MKRIILGGFLILLIALIAMPSFASAGLVTCGAAIDDPLTSIKENTPCTLCNVFDLGYTIINLIFFTFVPIVMPIFIVMGGFYFLIARGNTAQLSKGKTILTATVIGIIITYAAYVTLNTMLSFFGIAEWTGLSTWWHFTCLQ